MILELIVQTIREIKLKAMSTLKIIKDRLKDKRSKNSTGDVMTIDQ